MQSIIQMLKMLKLFSNEGIPPDEACQHEVTPLHVAVQNNDIICTKLLVNFGANVNQHFTAIDADDHEIDITPVNLVILPKSH